MELYKDGGIILAQERAKLFFGIQGAPEMQITIHHKKHVFPIVPIVRMFWENYFIDMLLFRL